MKKLFFVIIGLLFSVTSYAQSFNLGEFSIIIDVEESADDISLFSGKFKVKGTLEDADGEPIPGATLVASEWKSLDNSVAGSAVTGLDGKFTLELRPGVYYLYIFMPGYPHVMCELIVSGTSQENLQIVINPLD